MECQNQINIFGIIQNSISLWQYMANIRVKPFNIFHSGCSPLSVTCKLIPHPCLLCPDLWRRLLKTVTNYYPSSVAELARSCDPGSEKVENFGRNSFLQVPLPWLGPWFWIECELFICKYIFDSKLKDLAWLSVECTADVIRVSKWHLIHRHIRFNRNLIWLVKNYMYDDR